MKAASSLREITSMLPPPGTNKDFKKENSDNVIVAVAAPQALSPQLQAGGGIDTLQDLIARKREATRNKFKYHLTEADCDLLCTGGDPVHFAAGHVITGPDDVLKKIYRIKSGTAGLYKDGVKIKEITRGYFIGETLFIRSSMTSIFGVSMVADTPVEAIRLNITFARQLLTVDKVLAFKMYRYLASKMSALLFFSLSLIANDTDMQYQVLTPRSRSSSEEGSESSDSLSDGGSLSEDGSVPPSPSSLSSGGSFSSISSGSSASAVFENLKKESTREQPRKQKMKLRTAPFRVYEMDTPQRGQCLLFSHAIKFTCTIRQRKIKYNEILDMTLVGPKTITIIYKIRAKTIFFRTEEEVNEFTGIVKSLRLSNLKPAAPATPSPTSSPLNLSCDDIPDTDKVVIQSLLVRQDLKKGDVIIAEGDLYQRIYTVAAGQIASQKNGRQLSVIEEGETFGLLTLFHLRPAMVDLVVVSETATVLIIPGYKLQELVSTNFPLAVRMYKKAAQVIQAQVENTLMTPAEGHQPPNKNATMRANKAFV